MFISPLLPVEYIDGSTHGQRRSHGGYVTAKHSIPLHSLVPRPLPTREKGLVHTDCACARLYPESGYIVYSRKIISKLSIYDYVIFSISSRLANKHTRRAQRLRSSS